MSYRFMRSILFFDLPQVTSSEKRIYRMFLKRLKEIGFYMIQESVYVRLSIDGQALDSLISKIKSFSPKKGNIIVLNITEKQFSQMDIIIGESKTDVVNTTDRMVIL